MQTESKTFITIETIVNAPLEKVWKTWIEPVHIMNWNTATETWHCPFAENDVRKEGKFKSTMAAKDGSFSFDFEGVYSKVIPHQVLEYGMSDGRTVAVEFSQIKDGVRIVERFEPESSNPLDMQQQGWQAILNNFKKYTESL